MLKGSMISWLYNIQDVVNYEELLKVNLAAEDVISRAVSRAKGKRNVNICRVIQGLERKGRWTHYNQQRYQSP